MKKLFIVLTATMLCTVVYAQTVNIHLKNGKSICYTGNDVESVDFSETCSASSGTSYVRFKGCSAWWASRNLGAQKDSESGYFFTWGEKYGFSVTSYNENFDYFPQNRQFNTSEYNVVKFEDAAKYHWGQDWRVPTVQDINELLDNTVSYWGFHEDGIIGRWFVGRDWKTNQEVSIFFPAANELVEGKWTDVGRFGCYWASTPANDKDYGCGLFFGSEDGNVYIYNAELKWHGLPIRAVRDKE